MQATLREIQDVAILDLSGRLVAGDGDVVLRNQARGVLDGGLRKIIINLAGIQLMDSSGLGELVAAEKAARAAGATIRLLHVGAEVQRVLDLAGLTGAFETFDDEVAAIASFRG